MPEHAISIDELFSRVGTRAEPGEWITVDQERINGFADTTEDHQFIHVDQEAAASTPFGGTIAHGLLTLSLLPKLLEGRMLLPENLVMGINYGFDKVRFITPVLAGKRVRAHAELAEVKLKEENRYLVRQSVTVEVEGEDKPALVADWLNMLIVS
jgi:acyl dehydratase